MKIKEELFDNVEICESEKKILHIDFYISMKENKTNENLDNWITLYDDGAFGFDQNSYDNIFTKEQFDEIIRVRKKLINACL